MGDSAAAINQGGMYWACADTGSVPRIIAEVVAKDLALTLTTA